MMWTLGPDEMAREFDPRIMEACRILYDLAPSGQVVSLVRTWVMNGDDPVASARDFAATDRALPASS
jgi:hypothetical protein